jgi:hypothetical protein
MFGCLCHAVFGCAVGHTTLTSSLESPEHTSVQNINNVQQSVHLNTYHQLPSAKDGAEEGLFGYMGA